MLTPADILGPARIKIERANHHINDLNRQIDAFLKERPFKLFAHHKPKFRELTFKTKAEKAVPNSFAAIIGDAAHNLRSALDITMYALAVEKAPRPRQIQFPFPREAKGLEGAINAGQVQFAGEKVVEAVRALKPYPGGNELLCGLHEINARDKHRLIILTGRQAKISMVDFLRLHPSMTHGINLRRLLNSDAFRFTHAEGDDLITLTNVQDYGNRRGRLRMRDFEQETDFQPAYGITFGEGQPFEGQTVLPVLVSMSDAVCTAITRLLEAKFID